MFKFLGWFLGFIFSMLSIILYVHHLEISENIKLLISFISGFSFSGLGILVGALIDERINRGRKF